MVLTYCHLEVSVILMEEPADLLVNCDSLEGVTHNGACPCDEVVKDKDFEAGKVSDNKLGQREFVLGYLGGEEDIEVKRLQTCHLGEQMEVRLGVAGNLCPELGEMELEREAAARVIQVQRGDAEVGEVRNQPRDEGEDADICGAAVEQGQAAQSVRHHPRAR